jgi:hypothetical protein
MNFHFYEFQSEERTKARLQEAETHRLLTPVRVRNAQRTRAWLYRLKACWRAVFDPAASRSDSDFKPTTLRAQAEESK